jgi:hypothetical protein
MQLANRSGLKSFVEKWRLKINSSRGKFFTRDEFIIRCITWLLSSTQRLTKDWLLACSINC